MSASSNALPIRHPELLFINGEWRRPSGTSQFAVIDSGTEERIFSVAEAQVPDIEAAVAAARNAFDRGPWPQMSHQERATFLRAIAEKVRLRGADLASLWTSESGILHSVAALRAPGLGDAWEYYAGLADTFPFVEQHSIYPAIGVGLLVREPVGVVAAIIPWNAPAGLLTYKVAPALLAGCTVIVKASPEAPSGPYIFAEICEEVGLPPGVFNVVTASREVSEELVRHPGVDKITFTGSTAAGRKIASICGERIARCTLELGGKSAAVVLDDYDIGLAAHTITERAVQLTGQVCASLTRIIVPRNRHDAMVAALSACFNSVRVGDPFDSASQMGPLAMSRQRDRVESLIATAIAEGAKLAAGGGRPAHLNRGYFVEPTIFGGVDNNSLLAREEVFGPVLSVMPADSEEHAIEIANETIYGLNNAVFTNDIDRAYAAARRLRSGTVGHNGMRTTFGIAFGGFKQSGLGREGGEEGLRPFLETKTLLLDEAPTYLTTA